MSARISSCLETDYATYEDFIRALESRVLFVPSFRPRDAQACRPTDNVEAGRAQFTKPVCTENVCSDRERSVRELPPIALADCSLDRENETTDLLSIAHSNHCNASESVIKEVEWLYSIRSAGLTDNTDNNNSGSYDSDNNVIDDYDLRFMFDEKSNVDNCVLAAEDCSSELCLLFEAYSVETVNCCDAELSDYESDFELCQLFDVVSTQLMAGELCTDQENGSSSFIAIQNEVKSESDDDLSNALHEMFDVSFVKDLSVADSALSVMMSRDNKICLTLPEFADEIQRENVCRFVVSATNTTSAVTERPTSHGHVIKLSRITKLHCRIDKVLQSLLHLTDCFVCAVDILTTCCYAFYLPLIRQWKMRLKFY